MGIEVVSVLLLWMEQKGIQMWKYLMWYDMESSAYMFMSGTAGPDGNSRKFLKISMMLY